MSRPRPRPPTPAALLAATVLATACRPGAPPVPAAPEPVRLAPATARYLIVEHRHVEQSYQGQPIVTDAVTRTVFSVVIDSAPAGFRIEAVVDSVAVAGDAGVPPDAVAAAVGSRFAASLTPAGAVSGVTGPPDQSAVLDQLALRVHELVPSLPAGGAAPGTIWHDTTQTAGRAAGIPITIDTRGRHEGAPAWTEHGGRPVLPFATTSEYALAGEGERAGQWVSMAGTGSSHLRRLVTRDGLVALGIRTDTLRVTIELPAAGLRIPLTQIRTDTLRRLD